MGDIGEKTSQKTKMKMVFDAIFWRLVTMVLSNCKFLYYPVMCAADIPDLYFISNPHPYYTVSFSVLTLIFSRNINLITKESSVFHQNQSLYSSFIWTLRISVLCCRNNTAN